MAKDPAFLFYYDRFLAGTISMTDEEVGQYIRLMCIQANKGHVTKKDMLNICKSYDNDVCLKFASQPDGTFANAVLTEIVNQRKAYAESRRDNRKGNKSKKVSSTYVSHMVNKDVTVNVDIEEWTEWGKMIVEQNDQYWEQMKGRKVGQAEMDSFLSVATRNGWEMKSQHAFRTTLNGFTVIGNGQATKKSPPSKIQ